MAEKTKAHAPRPRKGKSSWLKDKSNLAKLGLLAGLVVVLVVVIVVLYLPGDDKKRGGTPPPVAQGAAPPPAPDSSAPPVPAPQGDQPSEEGPPEGEGGVGDIGYPEEGGETTSGPDGPDQQPKRPEDVADWKKDDYLSARAEGDSRLVEALDHLGQRFVGDARAARMLVQLLEPPKAEENPDQADQPGYRPRSYQQNPQLVQAVVAALGVNRTDASRTILVQILAGTLPTDDDKTAVDAALKVLAAAPSPQTDDILFRALSAAEKLRPQPKGEIGADQLRQMALAAVSSTASEGLRTKLARYLIRPDTPRERRDQMSGFLEQEHPDNVGAQLILYQSDETPPEMKATFEQYFVGYSSAALAYVLGIPAVQLGPPAEGSSQQDASRRDPFGRGAPGEVGYGQEYDGPAAGRPNIPAVGPTFGQPGGLNANQAAARPPDPDAPFRRARQLWSAQSVAIVEDRLGELASLDEQARLALLAATIPVDSTRSALWKALHDHWEDGPEQLEAAGLSTSLISDPGMLLTIKTLPRRQTTDSTTSPEGVPRDSYGRGNRYRAGGRDRLGQPPSAAEAVAAAKDAVQIRLEAERGWMKTSESLVRAWCERFHLAGLARAEAAQILGRTPGQGESTAKLPIKLHPEARVVSEYHLNWPGELGAKLSGIAAGPMEVHYVRMADTGKLNARLGFYRRQLRLDRDEVIPIERGEWLDKVLRVPKTDQQGPIDKTGWRRSVDVLVTAAQENPEPNRAGEIDLVVQILSIEMNNPAQEE